QGEQGFRPDPVSEPDAWIRQRAIYDPPPVGLLRAEPAGRRTARELRNETCRAADDDDAVSGGLDRLRLGLYDGLGVDLGLGPGNVDAAFEIGAVVDADAGGFDVADEAALIADRQLLDRVDIALDGSEDYDLARPDVRAHLAVWPDPVQAAGVHPTFRSPAAHQFLLAPG